MIVSKRCKLWNKCVNPKDVLLVDVFKLSLLSLLNNLKPVSRNYWPSVSNINPSVPTIGREMIALVNVMLIYWPCTQYSEWMLTY